MEFEKPNCLQCESIPSLRKALDQQLTVVNESQETQKPTSGKSVDQQVLASFSGCRLFFLNKFVNDNTIFTVQINEPKRLEVGVNLRPRITTSAQWPLQAGFLRPTGGVGWVLLGSGRVKNH